MSWGVDFTVEVYLSRQDYQDNPSLVQDRLDELSETIHQSESRLKMFAASSVKDIVPDEWKNQPMDWIDSEINTILESYKDDLYHQYQLEQYKEFLTKDK